MDQRPFVHIGFHKTATSWFQTAVYPRVTSHHLVDRDLIRSVFLVGDAFAFDAAAARAALAEGSGGKPLLISEEDLSGVLHIGAASTFIAKEVARRVNETFPDANIVAFVRAQPDAAASWYMQYLREGGTASAMRYLFSDEFVFPGRNMPLKRPHFDFSQLDYSGLIKQYDQLAGRDRVHVFAYEQLALDPVALLGRIRDLGLDIPVGDIPLEPVNTAYRQGIIPLARFTGLFTARSVANKRTLVHVPFWFRSRLFLLAQIDKLPIFGRRTSADDVLNSQVREWIARRFAASNRWLQDRMGMDLEALGYPTSPPEAGAPRPKRSPWLRWMRK